VPLFIKVWHKPVQNKTAAPAGAAQSVEKGSAKAGLFHLKTVK
jgi:hypothetical protein